mmetsp:Transcript_77648/g.136988  ORF Transcript_77648/g.136988 Transcript_77648/m.136988 type:complete len:1098 (+) Transcript_77648:77-3370(+)
MTDSLVTPKVPFCTIFLVVSTIVCNALVLLGNYWTADAFVEIGVSTKGWSKVGIGISDALIDELDEAMKNVSEEILVSLERVMGVQTELDNILSLVGNTTDSGISNSSALSLLDEHGPQKGMMLLQEMQGNITNHSALTTIIIKSVDEALDVIFDKVTMLLQELFETIKPTLIQIANWTNQFGDSVVKAIEEFSTTLDKAQKMFDQAMAQLATSGDNTDVMINNTFNLFDTEGVGSISVDSLISVGEYYAISALSGSKPYELIEKYDRDGDGVLDVDEYTFLVDDPDLTGVMGIVLRNYAKRLAEIAGAVGQATMRSEVASSTADYLRLVCAKNETKVGWIADRLSNNSLVGDFIGSVLVEMCIKNLDPNQPVYTDEDVGETVTTKMYEYNNTILDDMWVYIGNTSWWTDQGFNTQYQPSCAEMLVNWTLAAHEAAREGYPDLALVDVVAGVTLEEGVDKQKVMEAMPKAAFHLAQESVKLAKLEKLQVKKQKRSRMFSTRTGQMLLHRLQGGAMASRRADSEDSADSNAASQAIGGGTAALPTTLEFAKFLSYNATTTSSGYINDCTDYSGESSNSKDGFNSKIKGMLAKAVSFIETFQTYASAEGIAMIEEKFQNFTVNAVAEVKELIEERINGLIIEYEPQLEDSLHQAAYTTGEKIGTLIGSALSDPIAEALSGSIESALEDTIGEEAATEIADTLSDTLGSTISNFSAEYIGEYAGEILDGLIDQALESGGDILNNSLTKLKSAKLTPAQAKKLKAKGLSLSQQSSKRVELKHDLASISSLDAEIDALFASSNRQVMKARKAALYHERSEAGLSADLSSSWTDVYNLMTSFYNLIPQAVEVLKDAKEDVSTMASNLNSIFDSLEEKGPAIFDAVEMYWKIIWGVYFLFIMPFCVFTLYYGFWASGWFGGPQALSEDDVAPVPPTDFSGRVKTLCNSCCHCCKGFHDTHTCFWSVIILMQVMVLLTFLISIVLIIIAGVEFMMSSSCAAVYVVEDTDSCTQALETIQSWMATFSIDGNLLTNQTIGAACDEYSLLTCQMISTKLSSAAIYCAGFSFLASVFSLQMVFDSATLHEQAVCRRKAATLRLKAEGRF